MASATRGTVTIPRICVKACTYSDGNPVKVDVGIVCRRCWWTMYRLLGDLRGAWGWLGATTARSSSALNDGPRTAAGSRPPGSVDHVDARAQIEWALASWVREIVEESAAGNRRGLSGPQSWTIDDVTSGPHHMRGIVTWLRDHLDTIAAQMWVDEFLTELQDLRRTAYAVQPWERHRIDLPMPCRRCGLLTLALYGGDNWITCRNSQCTVMAVPWFKYEKWVRALASEYDLAAQ